MTDLLNTPDIAEELVEKYKDYYIMITGTYKPIFEVKRETRGSLFRKHGVKEEHVARCVGRTPYLKQYWRDDIQYAYDIWDKHSKEFYNNVLDLPYSGTSVDDIKKLLEDKVEEDVFTEDMKKEVLAQEPLDARRKSNV